MIEEFKRLVATVTNGNCIREEVKSRQFRQFTSEELVFPGSYLKAAQLKVTKGSRLSLTERRSCLVSQHRERMKTESVRAERPELVN